MAQSSDQQDAASSKVDPQDLVTKVQHLRLETTPSVISQQDSSEPHQPPYAMLLPPLLRALSKFGTRYTATFCRRSHTRNTCPPSYSNTSTTRSYPSANRFEAKLGSISAPTTNGYSLRSLRVRRGPPRFRWMYHSPSKHLFACFPSTKGICLSLAAS